MTVLFVPVGPIRIVNFCLRETSFSVARQFMIYLCCARYERL